MPVTSKPKPAKTVDEFINAAGTAASVEGVEERAVKLRLPTGLLEQVDQAVARRRPAPSRHQWLLEAIYEKLDRESTSET